MPGEAILAPRIMISDSPLGVFQCEAAAGGERGEEKRPLTWAVV